MTACPLWKQWIVTVTISYVVPIASIRRSTCSHLCIQTPISFVGPSNGYHDTDAAVGAIVALRRIRAQPVILMDLLEAIISELRALTILLSREGVDMTSSMDSMAERELQVPNILLHPGQDEFAQFRRLGYWPVTTVVPYLR